MRTRLSPGEHENSRKNLVITAEQRKINEKKAAETRRRNIETAAQQLWERMVTEGVTEMSIRAAADFLQTTPHRVQNARQWAREQKLKAREAASA